MPGTHSFAEVSYTLTDCLVATYNRTTNVYANPSALADGQMVKIEPEADTDKLRGYGQYTRGLAVAIGAKLTIGAGGVHVATYTTMTGATTETSGTTPNQVRKVKNPAGGAGLPYFGMIGVAATDDGGYIVAGLQCVKLDKQPDFTLDGNQNKFNISETGGYAFPINGFLHWLKFYETASDWTAPTTGAQFLAFFA